LSGRGWNKFHRSKPVSVILVAGQLALYSTLHIPLVAISGIPLEFAGSPHGNWREPMHCNETRSTGTRPLRFAVVAALSAAWLLLPPPSVAQTHPPGQIRTGPQGQSPAPSISDQKLDAAAAAIRQVNTVKETYESKIAAAPSSDKKRITAEANNALMKAVTDQGLSVDEYNGIIEMAQNNPTLREKLIQRVGSSAH
jgi:hypothetical protein